MPSSYTAFDPAVPDGSTQTGPNFSLAANANDVALWYAATHGTNKDFLFSKTNGTGTTEEPQYYLLTKSAQIVRATNTWAGGYLTQQLWEVSQDTGSTYATVCTQVNTFDGTTGAPVSTTGGGSMISVLVGYVMGRLKALKVTYDAHAAATGASVHGLGTMSTQASTAVAITGGSIAGVTLEYTTARGKKVNLGTITGSTAVDWAAGDYFYGTFSGAGGALTWSNLPGSSTNPAGAVTLELTNCGLATSPWPAGVKWPGASAPTRTSSGVDQYEFACRDGSTVRGVQSMKDSR